MPELIIRPARASDIPAIVRWARSEEFAPGFGDVDIYRNTDTVSYTHLTLPTILLV